MLVVSKSYRGKQLKFPLETFFCTLLKPKLGAVVYLKASYFDLAATAAVEAEEHLFRMLLTTRLKGQGLRLEP